MFTDYKETDKVHDMICDECHLLQVMGRFGIPLGCGDKTIREVCEENMVDTVTFLAVANYLKNGEKAVQPYIDRISIPTLMGYLRQSHVYFLDFQLPAIRRKLIESINCSQQNDVAFLILKFYDEYMEEVRRHMMYEDETVFVYVDSLLENRDTGTFNIRKYSARHESIDTKLQELKNSIIKYYKPGSVSELLNSALIDIFNCEKDLHEHCGLENCLFVPAVLIYEERRCLDKGESLKKQEKAVEKESLSGREKEVLKYIVRGLCNKMIAEKLFISVNTVLTHKKNIVRKLNIHSEAGLTIYAIVNGLINIEELDLNR